MLELLEGKNVNLRTVERDDAGFLAEFNNDIGVWGEYEPVDEQRSKSDLMKRLDNPSNYELFCEIKRFIIQRKDGTNVGVINHWLFQPFKWMGISYCISPSERGKGYVTEAVQLMIDYLFLSQNIVCIRTITNVGNKASQRVLKKVGFSVEGTVRKAGFVRGLWADYYIHSILREEWKEPKILTKTA